MRQLMSPIVGHKLIITGHHHIAIVAALEVIETCHRRQFSSGELPNLGDEKLKECKIHSRD
jgi:hypothetical protein